jgi:hypothetical protein
MAKSKPRRLAKRLEDLTRGQLLTLIKALSNTSRGATTAVRFCRAAEAVLPDPGARYIEVTSNAGDPNNTTDDDTNYVPLAWVDEFERRGMTEEEAVQSAYARRYPDAPARIVHYDMQCTYDADGELLDEEDEDD